MPPTLRLSYLHLLIFILIPGYVCLRGYLRGNLVLDDQGRTDKLIVIIIGGFASLCLTVLLHRVNIVGWIELSYTSITMHSVTFDPSSVPFNDAVKIDTYDDLSILSTAGVLIVESGIAGIIGFVYGRLKLPPEDREEATVSRRELRQPWQEAFEYATLDTEATVITTNGDEIHGTIEQLGSPSKDYDILLSDPYKIHRNPSGKEYNRDKIGVHSYHNYRDISRVEFKSGFDYPTENDSLVKRLWNRLIAEWKWFVKKVSWREETTEEEEEVPSLSMEEQEDGKDED